MDIELAQVIWLLYSFLRNVLREMRGLIRRLDRPSSSGEIVIVAIWFIYIYMSHIEHVASTNMFHVQDMSHAHECHRLRYHLVEIVSERQVTK